MDTNKDLLSIQVAKLYYESNLSQQDIAKQLEISRPTVSRLLQYAKENYVTITINDMITDTPPLEDALKAKYNLKDVKICYSALDTHEEITKSIGSRAAQYLQDIVKAGDIVGLSWGTTIYEMAQQLKYQPLKDVQVVQLKGGVSYSSCNTYAHAVIELCANAFGTMGRYLPLPVYFDNLAVKQLVEEDQHIKKVIQLAEQSNIAIFTVGTVRSDALLFRLGYFSEEMQNQLQEKAVGDLCSRFYDHRGEICDPDLDNRTVGIRLEQLRKKQYSILVAGGHRKFLAIKGALAGGYANILITDQYTAENLLKD